MSNTDDLLKKFNTGSKVKIDPFKDHDFLELLSRTKTKFKYEVQLSYFGTYKIEKICTEQGFELNSVLAFAKRQIQENTDYIAKYVYFAFMYRGYEFYLYDCHLDFFIRK